MAKPPRKSGPSTEDFKHLNIHVTRVKHLGEFRLELQFDNGVKKKVDLWPYLEKKKGLFDDLKDPKFFARVTVDPKGGTIVWPNGLDWAPDSLYHYE